MAKNKFKPKNTVEQNTHETAEQFAEHPKFSNNKGIVIKILSRIFGAKYLESEEVAGHLPFFIFLVIIGIIYITNTNMADKKIREINKLNKELKELRSEYIITKSELMFLSKQSEVAKRVEPIGLKETTQQPYLIINSDTTIKIY